MGFGKKSSPPPEAPKPVATVQNENRPDDDQKRGVPIQGRANEQVASKPLLTPDAGTSDGVDYTKRNRYLS